MPYAPLLNDAEIAEGLGRLPEWSREGDWIVRAVRCPTFRAAIDLVDRVADAAEAADHHPDMEIVWRRVTFRLTTKASGGISEKDLSMAARIDQLAEPAAE
ncbi:MAG TPA: 4a-hydroxytetrahydrobiopterin dehydratase [Candidatus Limnocylindria bacterium]|nr:4a-hydroxytetrahydrobiopterin dehydratase [Candidatus Limnocylindria bacterium]